MQRSRASSRRQAQEDSKTSAEDKKQALGGEAMPAPGCVYSCHQGTASLRHCVIEALRVTEALCVTVALWHCVIEALCH
eukprot:1160340-Pelagomonas_calceolata.AAC.1